MHWKPPSLRARAMHMHMRMPMHQLGDALEASLVESTRAVGDALAALEGGRTTLSGFSSVSRAFGVLCATQNDVSAACLP